MLELARGMYERTARIRALGVELDVTATVRDMPAGEMAEIAELAHLVHSRLASANDALEQALSDWLEAYRAELQLLDPRFGRPDVRVARFDESLQPVALVIFESQSRQERYDAIEQARLRAVPRDFRLQGEIATP